MPTFSHSRIETFRQCPRKYFYQYVARIKTPDVPEQIATFFGSRCHEPLEWLYKRVMNGTIPEREQVLAEFNRVWEEAWTDDVVISESWYASLNLVHSQVSRLGAVHGGPDLARKRHSADPIAREFR